MITARMNVDEFVGWALGQPKGRRYELVDGEVFAMSPERVAHGVTKAEIAAKLIVAIRAKRLPCDVFIDSMTVRVSDDTAYEPDIVVRCGGRLHDDAVVVEDPSVIVEILSPSTQSRDTTVKRDDYFRIPTLRHYVVVNAKRRTVTHYAKAAGREIVAKIDGGDTLTLDEPGITITDLFETRD